MAIVLIAAAIIVWVPLRQPRISITGLVLAGTTALALVILLLARMPWLSRVDRGGQPSGKWAWLFNLFSQWLGDAGPAVLFALLGTVLTFAGARRR